MYFFIKYVGFVIFCFFLAVFFFSIMEAPLQIVLFVGVSLAFFDSFKQNISSNEAEFFNLEQKINFEGNVIIKQNESFLKGNSAVIDLEKGLSSITSNEQNSVTGVFY